MSPAKEATGRLACRDLFESLRAKTGAPYISDMRFCYRELAIQSAAQEKADAYSLHEWNDALDYLLSHPACSSIEEAKQVFVKAARLLQERGADGLRETRLTGIEQDIAVENQMKSL